jgi:hypothetical protein
VPYCETRQVAYTTTHRVARCVPRQEEYTVTHMVARCVPREVAYEVCRIVPNCGCCDPCGCYGSAGCSGGCSDCGVNYQPSETYESGAEPNPADDNLVPEEPGPMNNAI